ncbi:hypothetical protein KUTeg_011560 [Tegillarca granosa]|uniref:EGF-like domain-containing protein n=1 Tax=Tegillarca granosa TaxID=220873 RepID=A0ABQ9EWZ1_TEGGR|nr:hypothetical protein KUTeg_011560 [Tegillarca granosa]
MKGDIDAAAIKASKVERTAVEGLMQNLYYLAKRNEPCSAISDLNSFLLHHNLSEFDPIKVTDPKKKGLKYEDTTKCDQNTVCQNGGTCEDGTCTCMLGYNGTFCEIGPNTGCSSGCINGVCLFKKCFCHPDYTGNACDIPSDRCDNDDPCLNGGVCSIILGTCKCSLHYTGRRCETAKACDNVEILCKNGGICKDEKCNCPQGYEGKFCESVKPCDNVEVLCKNGGMCKEGVCNCAQGYEGKFCESVSKESNVSETNGNLMTEQIDDTEFESSSILLHTNTLCAVTNRAFHFHDFIDTVKCGNKVCQNGAKCKDVINFFYFCICADGFTGTLCDTVACDNVKEICLNGGTLIECNPKTEPCQNKGSCEMEDGIHVCKCQNGFTGVFCENGNSQALTEPEKKKEELTTKEVAGLSIGVGTFAAIVLIIIIGYVIYKRKPPLKSLSSDYDNMAFSDVIKKEGHM